MAKQLPRLDDPSVAFTAPNGRLTLEGRRKLTDLLIALENRLPVTGTASFAGGTTATVTFATPEADANYDVWFSAPDGKNYWATSKTETGFTANVSSALTADVRYQIIRA